MKKIQIGILGLFLLIIGSLFYNISYATDEDSLNPMLGIGVLFEKLTNSQDSNGSSKSTFRLQGENVQDETITTAELAEGSITSIKITNGTIQEDDIHSDYALWNKIDDSFSIESDATINGVAIGTGSDSESGNTKIGINALADITIGTSNTAIGTNAASELTTGSNNIAIGETTFTANEYDTLKIANLLLGGLGTDSYLDVLGDMSINGDTVLNNDLQTNGVATFEESVDIEKDLTVSKDVTVTNNATINNNLVVENDLLSEKDVTIDGEVVTKNIVKTSQTIIDSSSPGNTYVTKRYTDTFGLPPSGVLAFDGTTCPTNWEKYADVKNDSGMIFCNKKSDSNLTQSECLELCPLPGYHWTSNNVCEKNTKSCPVANGQGKQFWRKISGNCDYDWSSCELQNCNYGYEKSGNICTFDTRSCSVSNGYGSQTYTGSGWGTCYVTSCDSGYTKSGNRCVVSDSDSCEIENGTGKYVVSGSNSVAIICEVVSCNPGYKKSGNSCVKSNSSGGGGGPQAE